jgi:glycosyltransferase involved in cell wall biosynthesis
MNILIVNNSKLPVIYYGGTERVIWYLGKTLTRLGHKVSFLVAQGSTCDFAKIIERNPEVDVIDQIPADIDLVHFHFKPKGVEKLQVPYLITIHGNPNQAESLDKNAVFVSKNHAKRHNAEAFVHNGLDWDDYDTVDFAEKRNYFHFLGKAAWRVKNVKGAINTTLKLKGERIHVLGGSRLNIKMGFRFTWQPRARFYGMVGGEEKMNQLKHSKGLVFPVRWHEPFGLAIIESLYFGAPVFGTPHGSLPELVNEDIGFLSHSSATLSEAMKQYQDYNPKTCHDYAATHFNAEVMSKAYLNLYEKVMNGENINQNIPNRILKDEPKFLNWEA